MTTWQITFSRDGGDIISHPLPLLHITWPSLQEEAYFPTHLSPGTSSKCFDQLIIAEGTLGQFFGLAFTSLVVSVSCLKGHASFEGIHSFGGIPLRIQPPSWEVPKLSRCSLVTVPTELPTKSQCSSHEGVGLGVKPSQAFR